MTKYTAHTRTYTQNNIQKQINIYIQLTTQLEAALIENIVSVNKFAEFDEEAIFRKYTV